MTNGNEGKDARKLCGVDGKTVNATRVLGRAMKFDHGDMKTRSIIVIDDVNKRFASANIYAKAGVADGQFYVGDRHKWQWHKLSDAKVTELTARGYSEMDQAEWPPCCVAIEVDAEIEV